MVNINRKQKKHLINISLALIFLIAALLSEKAGIPYRVPIVLYALSYATAGLKTLVSAFKNILRGQVFDEQFLMAIATVGAVFLGEFSEACSVMIFYQIGELFESIAVAKSRRSISELMDIRPDRATVLEEGAEVVKDPCDVAVGEILIVRPGEKIPIDGRIVSGSTFIDTSVLTGEAQPRNAECGDDVMSGCININGMIQVKTLKLFEDSAVAKILELVENASDKKARVEKFITKFARVYTPFVCISALLLAIIPPVLSGDFAGVFDKWLYRALTFLVISCPCALVISVPLAFFGGIGGAGKAGILIKGSNYIETLAHIDTIAFDKTGTLTTGQLKIKNVVPFLDAYKEEDIVGMAAYAENGSNHPVAYAITNAYQDTGKKIDMEHIAGIEEHAGRGISVLFKCEDGSEKHIYVGNEKLMKMKGIDIPENIGSCDEADTIVYVAVEKELSGAITFEDMIKDDARDAIERLKKSGIRKTVMFTGDRNKAAYSIAEKLDIDEFKAELLPQDKVDQIEQLISGASGKGRIAFVGDGINDAPVLARADVGIAMGALGSDAAIEAADIVIMKDELSKIADALKIARKTAMIARENVIFTLAIKAGVLLLAAIGYASMWAAIFADVGVAVLAIMNSIRTLSVKN